MTVSEKIFIETGAWLITSALLIFFTRTAGKKFIRFVLVELYELYILFSAPARYNPSQPLCL